MSAVPANQPGKKAVHVKVSVRNREMNLCRLLRQIWVQNGQESPSLSQTALVEILVLHPRTRVCVEKDVIYRFLYPLRCVYRCLRLVLYLLRLTKTRRSHAAMVRPRLCT